MWASSRGADESRRNGEDKKSLRGFVVPALCLHDAAKFARKGVFALRLRLGQRSARNALEIHEKKVAKQAAEPKTKRGRKL